MFRYIYVAFTALLLSAAFSMTYANEAGEKVTYYHHDHLGTPIMATDEQGQVEWIREYTPFGDPLANGDKEEIGYTGHEYTPESNLTFMKARWYNSELGRFMSPDPVTFQAGNPTSFNRFAYANNSPYMNIDPTGNNAFAVGAACLGGGCEAVAYAVLTFTAKAAASVGAAGIASIMVEMAGPPPELRTTSLSASSVSAITVADQKNKTSGSYTITFMDNGSLKYYHGKGTVSRMITSAIIRAKLHGSDPIFFEWGPSVNSREAYKAEYVRMQRDRTDLYREGKSNPVNYNIIQSPGKKYCVADGGCGL